MLPQVHFVQDNEGYIVLHLHEHRIVNRIEADVIRIAVVRSIHRVIQRQRPFFVGRVAKNEFKDPVLIYTVDSFPFSFFIIIIQFNFPFIAFMLLAVKRKSGYCYYSKFKRCFL